MRVLGVIPARGGSKGIPGKNLAPLQGRSLLGWTVATAAQSESLARVVLSTDDEAIATAGRALGVEVPFTRPDYLALDDTPTLPVLQHAVHCLEEKGDVFDAVFILQPTNPLRLPADIDGAIQLLQTSGADSVIGFTPVGDRHPARMKIVTANGRVSDPPFAEAFEGQPRQTLPEYFLRDGSVYVTRRQVLMDMNSIKGTDCRAWIVPEERAINIDTRFDLWLAGKMLERLRGSR
jgi:CMP-N,N'-diacetyllegionaminic acid synthase